MFQFYRFRCSIFVSELKKLDIPKYLISYVIFNISLLFHAVVIMQICTQSMTCALRLQESIPFYVSFICFFAGYAFDRQYSAHIECCSIFDRCGSAGIFQNFTEVAFPLTSVVDLACYLGVTFCYKSFCRALYLFPPNPAFFYFIHTFSCHP